MSGTGITAAGIGLWDGLHLLISLGSAALLAWAAGRYLFEAQRTGELELLLTTPIGAGTIISGNWRALCRPLRGVWLLVGFLILMELISIHRPYQGWVVFSVVMLPVVRVLDIIALCWVGMYFGLKAPKSISTIGWTVGLVVALPWLVSFLFVIGLSLRPQSSWMNGGTAPLLTYFWGFGWPCLNIAKDIFFINWAARGLRTQLRAKAVAWRGADWLH
jgi:hypothetical protein